MTVDTEEEAIAAANDSQFGLGASVWTKDREKGKRIARRIQSGMVWINDHMYSHGAMQTPWGGVKESGLGRAHSEFGFHECVNIKLIAYDPGLPGSSGGTRTTSRSARRMNSAASLLWGRDSDKLDALKRGAKPFGGVVAKGAIA